MLSTEQQRMLLSMLQNPMDFECNKIYSNRKSFNRAVSYLFDNGLVWKKDARYVLSFKGETLSKILASFADVDSEVRLKFGLGV